MNPLAQHNERFKQLLDAIGEEVGALKQEIRELKRENAKLKTKLDEAHDKQTDIFSAISESERLAMRQHINGLLNKIDTHLGS